MTTPPRDIGAVTEQSVLKQIRELMPARVLSFTEAMQRAEMQAGRLLSVHGVTRPGVPSEIVTELPHIRVLQSCDMPASGSTYWDGRNWVITLNASEYDLRRRFSLMHEFKHVIDHPTRHLIQTDRQTKLTAEQIAEKVADYFAACVLMPKAWVKTAFCNQRVQNIEALADLFQVSPKAMSFRLSQLGLTVPADRCAAPLGRSITNPAQQYRPSQRRRRYFRSRPTTSRMPQGVSP